MCVGCSFINGVEISHFSPSAYDSLLLCSPAGVSALAAEVELPSQKMQKNEKFVGYALYFSTYSTWEGRMLYMEDLCIRMEYRSEDKGTIICHRLHINIVLSSLSRFSVDLGIGTALMRECAKVLWHACNVSFPN